ncbi:MAG: hypothetical protein U1F41_03635 [Burkholderiales bacterium]
MSATLARNAPAAALIAGLGLWLVRTSRTLDAWLASRAKARDDSLALESMSERELRDIGIDPGRIRPAEWTRDWPL